MVDAPLAARDLQRFAGDYDLAPFIFLTGRFGFVSREGRLHLSYGGVASGAPLMALKYQGGGKFVTADDDEYTFSFGGGQPAKTVVAEFFDGTFPAARPVEHKTGP